MELRKVVQLSWSRFLSTEAGTEGVLYLKDRAPSIHKGPPHEMHFDAGVLVGYNRAIDVLREIIAQEPKKEIKLEND